MTVTTYHIHNVLRAYSTQLGKGTRRRHKKGDARRRRLGCINIFARARRKAVIDKVTSDIVHGIILKSPRDDAQRENRTQIGHQRRNSTSMKKEDAELVFKVIDKEKREITKTISIGNSGFLKDRRQENTETRANN
ncbi:MAG: DVU0524 family FlgM-associated protein [Desulfobacteria bacterium]